MSVRKGKTMLHDTLFDRIADAYWVNQELFNFIACSIIAVCLGWFGMGFLLSL
jgi:hypothetical protein